MSTVTAEAPFVFTGCVEVRQAVQKLLADCAVLRSQHARPVHRQFVRMASRHPFRPCLIDSVNKKKFFRYGEVLAGFAPYTEASLAGSDGVARLEQSFVVS